MKKSLLILILIVFNLTVFASQIENIKNSKNVKNSKKISVIDKDSSETKFEFKLKDDSEKSETSGTLSIENFGNAENIENFEITAILTKDPAKAEFYFKDDDGIERAETSLILEMDVIEAKKDGISDKNHEEEMGIRSYNFKNIDGEFKYRRLVQSLKKGQKIRFEKVYLHDDKDGLKISFHDLKSVE